MPCSFWVGSFLCWNLRLYSELCPDTVTPALPGRLFLAARATVDLCCKTAQSGMVTRPQLEKLPLLPFETHDKGPCCWDLLLSACPPPAPGWFAAVHPKVFQPPFALLECLLPRHPACSAASCSPQPTLCCSDLRHSDLTLPPDHWSPPGDFQVELSHHPHRGDDPGAAVWGTWRFKPSMNSPAPWFGLSRGGDTRPRGGPRVPGTKGRGNAP